MQCFGTNICRRIRDTCWVESCLKHIIGDNSELAIVTDLRFPNEADAILSMGGKVIRLTRNPTDDRHVSETALDDYENISYVCDNVDMSVHEKGNDILGKLLEWGWIKTEIEQVGQ